MASVPRISCSPGIREDQLRRRRCRGKGVSPTLATGSGAPPPAFIVAPQEGLVKAKYYCHNDLKCFHVLRAFLDRPAEVGSIRQPRMRASSPSGAASPMIAGPPMIPGDLMSRLPPTLPRSSRPTPELRRSRRPHCLCRHTAHPARHLVDAQGSRALGTEPWTRPPRRHMGGPPHQQFRDR